MIHVPSFLKTYHIESSDTYTFVFANAHGISGLVVEYIVAIDVTRVRFPVDAFIFPRP